MLTRTPVLVLSLAGTITIGGGKAQENIALCDRIILVKQQADAGKIK